VDPVPPHIVVDPVDPVPTHIVVDPEDPVPPYIVVDPVIQSIGCPFFASNKKMQNEAKRSKKDAKTNSKQARGSETKQNKVILL
jgi:hypothetical protein